MLVLGQIVFYVGLLLSVSGVIGGFALMYSGVDGWAKFCFMVVPLGFVLLFAGLSTNILFAPRDSDKF